uniref:Matrix remodeling-associated protein 8 n=1 Tax=Mola mola TaxID=94237 RepID=A0A3Q3W3F6_MOLML
GFLSEHVCSGFCLPRRIEQDGSSSSSTVVVAGYNVSAPARTGVVLQCVSSRMVWTRDAVRDRERVVHWDLFRAYRGHAMERVLDMYSTGGQRIYNPYNEGRVDLSPTAFRDGNFSLVVKDVTMNDRGLYSCNLHHLYCQLQEMVRIQLNVTKSRRKEQRFWDGQKVVYVVLLGSTVVLPCINRRNMWTDWSEEEGDQQVVHWDRQPPGVRHDHADRLVDLYASGEQRSYGPLFLQRKMNISSRAFTDGDFSLSISSLQLTDQGLYSCHLHHHYCGLHERREFQVTVEPPVIQTTLPARALPSEDKGHTHTQQIQQVQISHREERTLHTHTSGLSFTSSRFALVLHFKLSREKSKSRGGRNGPGGGDRGGSHLGQEVSVVFMRLFFFSCTLSLFDARFLKPHTHFLTPSSLHRPRGRV